MEETKKTSFRLVYRRSPLLVKIIVLITVALCTAVLIYLGASTAMLRAKTRQEQERAAQQARENQAIEQDINELGTPKSTQRIANEELGLVDPDTIIFETTE